MKNFYNNLTRKVLLCLCIVFISMAGFSATYYVSSSGSDTNSGLSSSLPWKTLSKVNSATILPGDQILFQRGNTFYGSLTIQNSGASGSPITIGAYGTGANPVITGFTTVDLWTNLGNNIWESTNAVSTLTSCNMVVINGVNTAKGRYPNSNAANSGYLAFQTHAGTTSIASSALSGTPNWTGAEVVIRNNHYLLTKSIITSQSGGTLNFSGTTDIKDGFGFFIQNDPRTLDIQNEWYYNVSTKKLRLYSTSQPTDVKVGSINSLLTTNGNYITVNSIDFKGSNGTTISGNGTYTTIQNCNISFSGINYINSGSAYWTVIDNTFIDANNNGLSLSGSHLVISRNKIQNTGIFQGMGLGNWDGINSAIAFGATGQSYFTVEGNRIINSGLNGIAFYGDYAIIKNNFIDRFCTILDDGGGIYTFTGGSRPLMKGTKIEANIVINGIGAVDGVAGDFPSIAAGIYCDENSADVEIFNNSIANCHQHGIFHNINTNVNVHHNTVYNTSYSQHCVNYSSGILSYNNIFVSRSATQYCLYILSGANDVPSHIQADNNYFARPLLDTKTFKIIQPNQGGTLSEKTLAEWQTFSSDDASSRKSPVTLTNENDLIFEYNASPSSKTISLSQPMMDVKGIKYTGSVILQPYTSVVLMKDPNAAVVAPGAPTSVVATGGNASASVTFVAPVNNGGSAITGYTVTSIPAGGIDVNAGSTSLNHTITGLTNGTSYSFTVKATNSVGTSVASVPSNSVIPRTAIATSFTFTGPSSGNVNSNSDIFTVTPNNVYTGTITITPSGIGSAGLSPIILTFSNSSLGQTFSITPTFMGSITLSAMNSGGLVNPSSLYYTVNTSAVAPGAPTSVAATGGNASASVTFVAPVNNGGSAITGYTVTSIPAGGIDVNAGSTSLNHTITGLTNGTSYTFTVKATNSVGTSVASAPSNSVIPRMRRLKNNRNLKSGQNMNLQNEPVEGQEFDEKNINILVNIDIFPNPSYGKVSVRFSKQPEEGSHIEILDNTGKKIISKKVSGMNEEFNLDNQPAGIYFVRSVIGENQVLNKLIINK